MRENIQSALKAIPASDFLSELDHTIIDYNKAIELKLGYADAHYNRGIAYLKKKEAG